MLKESLRWRHSFGVSKLGEKHERLRRESETGKLRVSESADRAGRPVLVMTPRAENSRDHDGQMANLVYHLERATGGRCDLYHTMHYAMHYVMHFAIYNPFK